MKGWYGDRKRHSEAAKRGHARRKKFEELERDMSKKGMTNLQQLIFYDRLIKEGKQQLKKSDLSPSKRKEIQSTIRTLQTRQRAIRFGKTKRK